MNKTTLMAVGVLFLLVIAIMTKENKSTDADVLLNKESVVLAFGDSLTYGYGVKSELSYPKQMEASLGMKVVNAGVNGEISSQGLTRLPALLLKHQPDLVILCHGGNDILKKLPFEQLKNNLIQMIELIEQSGALVLLVGVPELSPFSNTSLDLYQSVAYEADVLYEDSVLKHIYKHRSLKSDFIHPNEKGYKMMSDSFIEVLTIH